MIGTVEFNSSTLYRYATIDVDELAKVLGSVDAAARAVPRRVEGVPRARPTARLAPQPVRDLSSRDAKGATHRAIGTPRARLGRVS